MARNTTAARTTRAQANADALEQAAALAAEQAQASEQAPEPTPTPTPEPTPEPELAPTPEPTPEPELAQSSRRAAAEQAQARSATASKPLVLAEGCEWHPIPGLGKSGITVEQDAQGRVREYLTWVPSVGRVQKVPTYGVFPVMDAGDLD